MEQKEFDFLIARYNGLSSEIEFAKNKTWAVTGATIALYGIVIKYFTCPWVAGFISLLICFASLFYLISCSISLRRNDIRMREVLKRFPSEKEIEYILFMSDINIKKKKDVKSKVYNYIIEKKSPLIQWLHCIVVGGGFVVVIFILIFA